MPRHLTESDIDWLSIGAAILGAGGGGDPYLGKLQCRQELRRGKQVPLISLDELADDALVVPVGGIGAPSISIEKLEEGREGLRALRTLEKFIGRRADALIAAEIGGGNALAPIIVAAAAGIGVVDADGMGRAFPEMQMTTFSIYGHRSTPATLADERGNVVLFENVASEAWYEKLARSAVVAMGGIALGAEAPMQGRFVKRAAVPDTVTRCIGLGKLVTRANREHHDAIPLIIEREHGVHVMTAKIVDLKRHLRGGFSVGEIALEGIDADAGSRGRIVFQNEYLSVERAGTVEVSVPDLIVLLDADTGHAITTDVLRFGQRVAVLGLPCSPLLRTPRALEVVGPTAFGLTCEFKPLPPAPGATANAPLPPDSAYEEH
jgi:DUF917 family protein